MILENSIEPLLNLDIIRHTETTLYAGIYLTMRAYVCACLSVCVRVVLAGGRMRAWALM